MNYRVYEHIVGFPAHMDTIVEELEDTFDRFEMSVEDAEEFIEKFVTKTDKYGRERKIYIHKLS